MSFSKVELHVVSNMLILTVAHQHQHQHLDRLFCGTLQLGLCSGSLQFNVGFVCSGGSGAGDGEDAGTG